jgi:hypothetical protein
MTTLTLTRPPAPRAAFASMVLNEARLAWRQPAGMIAGAGIALLLLVIFGEIPAFRQSSGRRAVPAGPRGIRAGVRIPGQALLQVGIADPSRLGVRGEPCRVSLFPARI